MSKNNPQFLNLKKTLAVVLLCMMTVVVSAQSDKQLPSAILVHTECCDCKHPTYDTLCHFSYEDITLTDTSITFRDMECIHYYDDKDNPNRVRYLCGTYYSLCSLMAGNIPWSYSVGILVLHQYMHQCGIGKSLEIHCH